MTRALLQTDYERWNAERERIARRKPGWIAALLRRFAPVTRSRA